MDQLRRARPRGRLISLLGAAVLGSAVVTAGATAQAEPSQPAPQEETHVPTADVVLPDGSLAAGQLPPQPDSAPDADAATMAQAAAAEVVGLHVTGPSSERLDLVFVGDGYTAAQLDQFHQKVAGTWAQMATGEPFAAYRDYINVWMVDAVSNESGVDDDPAGLKRDTAMDMGVRCGLPGDITVCVNTDKAAAFAAAAPGADQVLAVANSSVTAGSSYSWLDVAAITGNVPYLGDLTAHELGHGMADLGDEYFYDPNRVWTGNELSYSNLSIYDATAQTQGQRKWYQYLGQETPDGGVIGTFEGGLRHGKGIYRPSDNSRMRDSRQPFNLVGLDAMEEAMLAEVVVPDRCSGYEVTKTGTRKPGDFVTYHPDDLFYVAEADGLHQACLDGPLGAEYNLALYKWVGDDWEFVEAAYDDGPFELLTYEGTAGYYKYGVVTPTESGFGTFTLAFNVP